MLHTGLARETRLSGVLGLVMYSTSESQGSLSSSAAPPPSSSIMDMKRMHRHIKTSDLSSLGKNPNIGIPEEGREKGKYAFRGVCWNKGNKKWQARPPR